MKKFFVLFLVSFAVSTLSAAKDFSGDLRKIESEEKGKLVFECEIRVRYTDSRLQVTLDPASRFLEAHLENQITVKGTASETYDGKTGSTYYFLQGGSQPYFQQLTLVLKKGGESAEFKKTYGGDSFICQ